MTRKMSFAATATLLMAALFAQAQGPPGPPEPPRSAREAAPVDLTGYWVAPVMEDWRWRMVTPLKGDFAGVPVSPAGRKVGEAWDPAADEAAGALCKAYGAPALMRIPLRLHITWQDDDTLKIETDEGRQTRLLRFGGKPPENAEPSLQGYSAANWERPLSAEGLDSVSAIFVRRIGRQGRALEAVTTNLLPGYLRKNGVPYGGEAWMEEFFDYRQHPDGEEWFTVTTIVHDPEYLATPFITSSDFKKEPDDSKWNPQPCLAP